MLVPEGRKGICDHLRELQRRAIVVVSALERLDEPLERSAEILEFHAKRPASFIRHAELQQERNKSQRLRRKGWPRLGA